MAGMKRVQSIGVLLSIITALLVLLLPEIDAFVTVLTIVKLSLPTQAPPALP